MKNLGFRVLVLSTSLAGFSAIWWSSKAEFTSAQARSPAAISAEVDPDYQDWVDRDFTASHPASKRWSQKDLLARVQELAIAKPKVRIDVFRVFEERSNDGALLDRRAVFPEVQFYSARRESHSLVTGPTPVEFMAVWVNDSLEFVFAVSSATYRKRFVPARDQWEHPVTPNGPWSPIYLNPLHHSNTYKAVGADIGPEMPFSIFIDDARKELLKSWSGYAFHGTTLSHYEALGTPDSGGCIRLAREDAEVLFALVNPSMQTLNRFGKWYRDNDERNKPHPQMVSIRERMQINIIDPEYMDKNPAFAAEINERYENLLAYMHVAVNTNIQRSAQTLKRGVHRTLTEKVVDAKIEAKKKRGI